MTDQSATKAANLNQAAGQAQAPAGAETLLAEMQALFSLMPGSLLAHEGPLPTDDEVEAMFDNMPV